MFYQVSKKVLLPIRTRKCSLSENLKAYRQALIVGNGYSGVYALAFSKKLHRCSVLIKINNAVYNPLKLALWEQMDHYERLKICLMQNNYSYAYLDGSNIAHGMPCEVVTSLYEMVLHVTLYAKLTAPINTIK